MAEYPKSLRVDTASGQARYDIACKRLLSVKGVLAHIMAELLVEYRGCTIKDIAERYILDDSSCNGDLTRDGETASRRVGGIGCESADPRAGAVIYDVLVRATIPGATGADGLQPHRTDDPNELGAPGLTRRPESVGLLIDIEPQDDFYPGYPLPKRAVYYCARLLSDQRGTEFSGSHYERLKKVCSIWICTKPPRGRQGTVSWYELSERTAPGGGAGFDRRAYDLISVVVICLRDEDTGERSGIEGLVNLLSVLLSRRIDSGEKLRVLHEYTIDITDDLETEVTRMLTTVEEILLEGWNKGIAEGREEGRTRALADGVTNLMRATGLSLEKAMELLGIPEPDRPACIDLVEKRA